MLISEVDLNFHFNKYLVSSWFFIMWSIFITGEPESLKYRTNSSHRKCFGTISHFRKKKLIEKSSHLLLVSVLAQFFILPNEYEPCVSLLSYRSAVSICHGLKMFVGEHPFPFRFLFCPYFFKCPIKCNFAFKIWNSFLNLFVWIHPKTYHRQYLHYKLIESNVSFQFKTFRLQK